MSDILSPILLVEDDPNDVLFFQKALQRCAPEARLQIARDGQEALDYLDAKGEYADRAKFPPPAVVVLDLKLPACGGLEVLTAIRASRDLQHIPVVILTSSQESRDVSSSRELGVDEYLIKPVRFADLLRIVQHIGARWGTPTGQGIGG
jgi:CheY-like chemotaxis protein